MKNLQQSEIGACTNVTAHHSRLTLPEISVRDRKLLNFTQEWEQHQSSIRSYLACFLGNSTAVDDALQEVALVVWRKGPWDEGSRAFLGYSLACARRIALATSRKQRNDRMELLSPQSAKALADKLALLEYQVSSTPNELLRALQNCLEKLRPEHRELLASRYSGDSKAELYELSKRLGKSMDALYKTLERLRELLRACLERGLAITDENSGNSQPKNRFPQTCGVSPTGS